MNAVILLDKPAGMTSFTAVKKVGHLLHEKKGGHTGTLDPNATGLMICLYGSYTKLVPYAISNHKQYEADFILGKTTTTEDIWGEVIQESQWRDHSQAELDEVSRLFLGKISQVPPMYSAIRHNGKKLYEYARQGLQIERQAREVEVSQLKVTHLHDNFYHMHACVSSGTYIRTLITDYGRKIGEAACMISLRRTAIENALVEDACDFTGIEQGKGSVPPLRIISPEWHQIEMEDPDQIANGQKIHWNSPYEKVIFTANQLPLAAYEKRIDGYYHCLRGLK